MTGCACWEVIVQSSDQVFLIDQDTSDTQSVTNDAENVVKALLMMYGPKQFIYRDTEGRWDELFHDGEKFTGFGPYDGWVPS